MYALAAASDLANHQSYGGLELNEFELIDVYSGCVAKSVMQWRGSRNDTQGHNFGRTLHG